jgi:hypothetical protein
MGEDILRAGYASRLAVGGWDNAIQTLEGTVDYERWLGPDPYSTVERVGTSVLKEGVWIGYRVQAFC